jgi:hypothetical protein
MSPPLERDSLEELLAAARPAPVPGLGERSCAAVGDRRFASRIAWLDAGDAARRVLWIAIPLLVVATALAIVSLSGRGRAPEPRPRGRPFQPSFRDAGFLGQELD